MNKQEIEKAIKTLEKLKSKGCVKFKVDGYPCSSFIEIEPILTALEHQLTDGWIPVTERLPEDTDGDNLATVYVCIKFKNSPFGNSESVYQEVVDFMTDKQIWLVEDEFKVTAWRPRFEPWKETV